MITSLDNKTVKELTKLHQKKYRNDEYLLLDESLISVARQTGYLKTLICVDEIPFEFENVLMVSQEVLDKISQMQGLKYIGVGKIIKPSNAYKNRVIILDHLQDPLNIGRIMEEAYLFGFDSVLLSENCADIYNEKCLINSKGSIYKLNIYQGNLVEEISNLKNMGFKIYATGLRKQTKQMTDILPQDKMAFILGNEGSGVDDKIMDISDEIIKIDMVNIDSLNVGMAGAIIMYNFSI